jgi:serine/threonine-protein kinase
MRYCRIITQGQGGFGKAVVCTDENLERTVIKKQVVTKLALRRLLDEIKALQATKSKNVVQIYDVILSENYEDVAIIEEYLPGDDLMGFRAGNNNTEEYIRVLYQLASGLSDIHDCGIVHRDFKPNNVKYDEEKTLKIFDFGLSKVEKLPTSTVGLVGTFGFMAPELYKDPPIIDKPVDCYSFGATAFFFVLGKPPACCLNKPVPRQLAAGEGILSFINISNKLAQLLDGCLDVDPRKRPIMSEIKEALGQELLFGKHKATIVLDGRVYTLNKVGKGVIISRGNKKDSVQIFYDGYSFIMRNPQGNVYVNDIQIIDGYILPGASVITLGGPSLGWQRKFPTFDISHPEVLI